MFDLFYKEGNYVEKWIYTFLQIVVLCNYVFIYIYIYINPICGVHKCNNPDHKTLKLTVVLNV